MLSALIALTLMAFSLHQVPAVAAQSRRAGTPSGTSPTPLSAASPSDRVHIFYYPWYGTPTPGGWLGHWEEGGHTPPDDIGSNFYPKLGTYDSLSSTAIDQHMTWIAQAGAGVVVTSWWGQGSREDQAVSLILDRAAAHGL